MSSNPIREAIRLLREASDLLPYEPDGNDLTEAADALERLVTDPRYADLEWLARGLVPLVWHRIDRGDARNDDRREAAAALGTARLALLTLGREQP